MYAIRVSMNTSGRGVHSGGRGDWLAWTEGGGIKNLGVGKGYGKEVGVTVCVIVQSFFKFITNVF